MARRWWSNIGRLARASSIDAYSTNITQPSGIQILVSKTLEGHIITCAFVYTSWDDPSCCLYLPLPTKWLAVQKNWVKITTTQGAVELPIFSWQGLVSNPWLGCQVLLCTLCYILYTLNLKEVRYMFNTVASIPSFYRRVTIVCTLKRKSPSVFCFCFLTCSSTKSFS